MKSLSKGGIFYLIYNVLNMAFPFFTGIYVTRVLLPDSIGNVAAAQNLAQYFVILAFLGIPTYGLREIAKTCDNKEERSIVFSELYIINLISTLFFSIAYLIIIVSIKAYRDDMSLYLIAGISIALNAFNISWLFEGMEEFAFISIRNVIFKAIAFVFLVLFVRSKNDILMYALVTVVGTAGNYIVNMMYSPRYVRFIWKGLKLRRHMKPVLYLVAVNLAIELYSLVDITMMNFMCDKEHIAYYKYGIGIERMLLQVVNTFTMVLVPRISFYYKEHRINDFNQLISKALKLIIITSMPMIVGLFFTSNFLIVKLYGDSYIVSAEILKLLSWLLLISPIGYLLGSRVLLATGNENKMIISVGSGALANIIGNAFLIPKYNELGASISSVISELIVMAIYVNMGRKYFRISGIKETVVKVIISSLLSALYLYLCSLLPLNGYCIVMLQIIGTCVIYSSTLVLAKESIALEYYVKISKAVKNLG